MIPWDDLRSLAAARLGRSGAGVVEVLRVWLELDPDAELAGAFAAPLPGKEALRSALEGVQDGPAAEGERLLREAALAGHGRSLLARHVLLALCRDRRHPACAAAVAAGIDVELLRRRLEDGMRPPAGVLARHGLAVEGEVGLLSRFGRDLLALAKEGRFDALCDRPREIERLEGVLLRQGKGNAALTGPAGVGKTALVELFARKLARGELSPLLRMNGLFELSMGRLVAGTRYRGDFEERLEKVLDLLRSLEPVIAFIDEMHLIWGAGRAEDVITDAANLLKPVLAREKIRVIGATTSEEYARYIARDEALARRFQELRLEEPDPEQTLAMAKAQARALGGAHGVAIGDEHVRAAIELSDAHMPSRRQPDKSVDLLDSAAVHARRAGRAELARADLGAALGELTGSSAPEDRADPQARTRGLKDAIRRRIVGQDHVVDRVVDILHYRRQGLGDPKRCLAAFLFAGSTGVGKTELARVLAEEGFGSRNRLLEIDLADCSQPGRVNALLGSPPGYSGSDRDGRLVSWLRSHGSGVVLFDELEKAHPEVQDHLLALLDTGRLATPRGETLDARGCAVVFTTNALTTRASGCQQVGFHARTSERDVADLLAESFPRELLGRLDESFLFRALSETDLRRILGLRLDEELEKLEASGIAVSFERERALDHVLAGGGPFEDGARRIPRLLRDRFSIPLSSAWIELAGQAGDALLLDEAFYAGGGPKLLPGGAR
ncbi:MAG: ATP-dependent Clp protease ATP-binding subunit [Planctomycetes bacterium]|nr:ATP-dependent Clp protease ATP-binding subunit [Planctomycetota bacterium]